MQDESRRARSHGWWRDVVDFGAWSGPLDPQTSRPVRRCGPPKPEDYAGIARLFGTTADQVRRMVAAEWYGAEAPLDLSSRALRVGALLDELLAEDLALVENLIARLAPA